MIPGTKSTKMSIDKKGLIRPLAKFFKAPLELNIYSSGSPLGKGDGRGISKGGWGDQSFFLQEVYC
jgi:hypothetical protein